MGKKTASESAVKNIKRENVSPDKFVSLYVNDLQVQITPWDFRVLLGLVTGTPSKESPELEIATIGEIRMSPQLAKRLLVVLQGQVQNYEQSVGPIPLAKD